MKRFARTLLFTVLLFGALLPVPRTLAAVHTLLKLADPQGNILIEGESLDKAHPKEIVALSFSQGLSVPFSPAGGGTGKASFSELAISKIVDKATPLLYSHCVQ